MRTASNSDRKAVGNTMFDLNFSNTAEMVVGVLLVLAVVIVTFV